MGKRGSLSASVSSDTEPCVEADDTNEAEADYAAAREGYIARKMRFAEIPGYQPDWFLEAQRAEYARTNFEDCAYLESVFTLSAMRKGDFGPLAVLLKERAELPALIRRELVFLIEGDAEQSGGHRLSRISHPDIDARRGGRTKLMQRHNRDYSIAAFIACKGGHDDNQVEAAVADAKAFFSMSRSALFKIWSEYKDELKVVGLGADPTKDETEKEQPEKVSRTTPDKTR